MKAALRKGNSLLTCLKNPFFGIENSQATLKLSFSPLPISFVWISCSETCYKQMNIQTTGFRRKQKSPKGLFFNLSDTIFFSKNKRIIR